MVENLDKSVEKSDYRQKTAFQENSATSIQKRASVQFDLLPRVHAFATEGISNLKKFKHSRKIGTF
jgi:hypothetical protein